LYYSAKVLYPDFAVDYYFVDTNVWDTWLPEAEGHHNICSDAHNPPKPMDNCGIAGPVSKDDCKEWFTNLWNANKAWLQSSAHKSTAQWQIVITHFPPEGTPWGGAEWAGLSSELGLDLILTGHRHTQEIHQNSALGATMYIVAGGGGGITSENEPSPDGQDDEYGFVDLTLTREEIMVEMISHGGQIRNTVCTTPRAPGATAGTPLTGTSLCASRPQGPQPLASASPFGGAAAGVPAIPNPFFGGAPAPPPPATAYAPQAAAPAYPGPADGAAGNPIQGFMDRFRSIFAAHFR
jgi:hypothetical protein